MDILQTITQLSHEFGTINFVRGGGGNTSCKDEKTLWVKPSGTTLARLTPEAFVAIDRGKLSELYHIETPGDPSEREALVKQIMEKAILPESSGRASVEAPLHNSLQARYIVHTHPAVVNGMTCSKNAKEVVTKLFPDALWLDYIDPGYTLCVQVRKEIQNYKEITGREPSVILLKNHGVFVAADTPEDIRQLYADIRSKLEAQYQQAGISTEIQVALPSPEKCTEAEKRIILEAMQNPDLHVAASDHFDYAVGPISPDHLVYSKSYPFVGEPTAESINEFKAEHGYLPQVVAFNNKVFGVAGSEKAASLALELAQDGALVQRLAAAFGGINYMTDRAREFIENWEVESYRMKQIEN